MAESHGTEEEPLLGPFSADGRSRGGEFPEAAGDSTAAVNLLFLKRTWHLMTIARCGDSFFLIILSVLEVAILSRAGLVIGNFYNALISKNSQGLNTPDKLQLLTPSHFGEGDSWHFVPWILVRASLRSSSIFTLLIICRLWREDEGERITPLLALFCLFLFLETVGQYVLWYSAETLVTSTEQWAAEWLAIGWRQRLTQAAHLSYCSGPSLSRLSQQCCPIDNPDERITNEINSFCANLAQLTLKTIASPLMIVYYSFWVGYHVGWYGPVVVYVFFAAGALWTRCIISPIAALVAKQEKLEAFFRISHVRFHASADEIAMSGSRKFEKARLEDNLQSVLKNKKKLVSRHFLLAVITKAFDYIGGALNYAVLAIPVFGGLFDSDDSGELANLISNASFSVLQLIYSFSQLLETAKLVSDLAGHAFRVSELFEGLKILPSVQKSSGLSSTDEDAWSHVKGEPLDPEDVHRRMYLIGPPTYLSLRNRRKIELSIHFSQPKVHEWLARLFPGIDPCSLLITPVFEMRACNPDNDAEIDKNSTGVQSLLSQHLPSKTRKSSFSRTGKNDQIEKFPELILLIRDRLRDLGHWAEASDQSPGAPFSFMGPNEEEMIKVDSCTAIDVEGPSMPYIPPVWNEKKAMSRELELDAMNVLLNYRWVEAGPMSVLDHPKFGRNYLLSIVFTTAPANVLRSAVDSCMREVSAASAASFEMDTTEESEHELPLNTTQPPNSELLTTCDLLPALVVDHMTSLIPGSQTPVVHDLTLELRWGESLLIMGPTGSGKSSLLRALCGVWPLRSGKIQMPPLLHGKGTLVLPQHPLLPKVGLAAQILYPEAAPPSGKLLPLEMWRMKNVLEGVGMLHLRNQLRDDWEVETNWADILSPGEQQLLALARVLYHRPQLAILDEATSALSEDAEDAIYKRMMEMGISIISVAHRSRLIRHHTKLLRLFSDGKGGWSIT